MKKNISESLENYLRVVYILHIDGKIPRIKEISKMLEVRDASTVEAIKKLEKLGYVTHEKYGYIDLTDKGLSEAERVYRKYITLVDFFVNMLNLSKEEAYKLACGVEHHMTENFFVSLESLLIFLKRNPIEYKKLQDFTKKYKSQLPHIFRTTLDEIEIEEEVEILDISGDQDMKEKIFKMGIYPGMSVSVKEKNENSLEINLNSKLLIISIEDAKMIIVE
ncbi:metal-dependent transcriptional regulator [Oceanotoga sp. DSM 15011]|jgi:DtxR family Mn-dependent transcriptional regulator|uniref:DtxR family iron (Metal) dependent repressor n=1 Tax=Oceanotoga teriensis TaxID=515440 RepID=A0AA45HHP6_9BACT|nr:MULTISPECIES: metal-dependent transcriptional regulator [Oceanotoga]MDN5343175.1 DtxR family transcriptional regulator, Mn-dependent transcriptional regulator [Oceanotoga sp.]MDO7977743.1 metal-dependent transcriptional regulator [Oceanotoga teriensis]PWJ87142.1 DtxR family iron (metal) dependent repressor [Oceanotoga teriensis]UYP00742.1 metal-dependent transcriptional regulator [Oceanotoga sp. DSM 15011]